jgi:hypothetical protein
LIAACPYSFHDLSRVQLDKGTPRFNMPFELGLAVATAHWRPAHQWFLFEAKPFRVQRTLSDLGGTDAYIHAERQGPRRVCLWLQDSAFVTRVLEQPKLWLIGDEGDLAA